MTDEYGVACLLDTNSVKSLKEYFPFLEKKNHPHVSLFQFKCSDKTILTEIKLEVKKLSVSNQFSTNGIVQAGENLFLNIKDDHSLQSASDHIADFCEKLFHNMEFLSQINITELTHEQKELVKKYGIYWIRQFYQPHVTLLYEHTLNLLPNINIPKTVTVLSPEIYRIDLKGRINSKT